MNLYTVHQKKQRVTSAPRSQANKNVYSLNWPKSTSSCCRVLGRV